MSKHVTRNGTQYQFSLDPESKARLLYCQAGIEQLTGTDINQSAVVRLALRYLTFHLEEMLSGMSPASEADPLSDTLTDALKYNLRTSLEGSRSIPVFTLDSLKALPLPVSFAELKARLQQSKVPDLKQLLGRPMYESRARRLAGNNTPRLKPRHPKPSPSKPSTTNAIPNQEDTN